MMDVTADTVLATVSGIDITVGHVIAALGGLEPEEQGYPNDVLLEGLTERLIQQAAISASQTEISKATQLKLDNERHALVASDAVQAMSIGIDVGEEDVQAAYDARFGNFKPDTEYDASHILVQTEDEAKALVALLEGGADFAELAKEKSTGPSGPNGGNLGWFARGQMVEAFQDAVETLEVGAVSAPVETQFGWHVIKLNETRVPETPTFEQMANELQTEVFRQKLFAEIGKVIDSAEIERLDLTKIDPAVLRDTSLIQN